MALRATYHLLSYYLTLLFFALGGLGLNLFSFLTGWLPDNERTRRFFQRLIHRHFALFHWWCEFARLVYVRYRGFERIPRGPLVLVANHPALIDITCLLARVPEAVCAFKSAIRRNPVLGAGARRAGYIANDGGIDFVRLAAEKVAAGRILVIFPEGTRTPLDQSLLPFKAGFALIARRARAPIQLVRITTDSDVLRKGRKWWWLPKFPAHVLVEAGPLIATDTGADSSELSSEIEAWFRTGATPAACHIPAHADSRAQPTPS